MSGLGLHLPSPLSELDDTRLGGVRLLLKRDDLIGVDLGGNKWRKLKYVLDDACSSGADTLLTFGGAYSNHVRAVAAAGHHLGFRTIGVIRGEERPFNESLARAVGYGMQLHYVSRADYRRKHEPEFLTRMRERFGAYYLVPEGGTTPLSVRGCRELVAEISAPFDVLCCPVGTGGTLAGLSAGLQNGQLARGYAVLRDAAGLEAAVSELQSSALGHPLRNWEIDHRYHFGGFARRRPVLDSFIADFTHRHGIVLDHVYVAKMMFGIFAAVAGGEIREGTTVVAVVTGGPPPRTAGRSTSVPTRPS